MEGSCPCFQPARNAAPRTSEAKTPLYYQCALRIWEEGRTSTLITWVHEKRCVEGLRVSLKNDEDKRVWTVDEVYRRFPLPEDVVKERQKAHDRWRKVTDV